MRKLSQGTRFKQKMASNGPTVQDKKLKEKELKERLQQHYVPELPLEQLTPEVVELFEKYCKVPKQEVKAHIERIVGRARPPLVDEN